MKIGTPICLWGFSLLATTRLFSQEMFLVQADYGRPPHPILISRLDGNVWTTEAFAGGALFSENFMPCPGIAPDNCLWLVWAARLGNSAPRIYFFRLDNGATRARPWYLNLTPHSVGRHPEPRLLHAQSPWSSRVRDNGENAPQTVGKVAGHWEESPAIAFDSEGKPWVCWSRVESLSSEIFCAGWGVDGFRPEEMISAPDDSPDTRPTIAFLKGLGPVVAWEGSAGGRSRIFYNYAREERWQGEGLLSPDTRADQVLPLLHSGTDGSVISSWKESGETITTKIDPENPARRRRLPSRSCSLIGQTQPLLTPKAWILRKNPDGNWEAYRPAYLSDSRSKAKARPPFGNRAGAHYCIGYGDSITCGHDDCSDYSGWYGALLAPMLTSAKPGTYYLYNEGYLSAETSDLLYGSSDPECPGIYDVLSEYTYAEKILIMGGTNDVEHGVAPSNTKYYLGQMIDRARSMNIEPVLATIIPNASSDTNWSLTSELNLNYIAPLCGEKNCQLASPWHVYLYYFDHDPDYFWHDLYGYPDQSYDGIHPAWPDGDQEIANAWFKVFVTPTPSPTRSAPPSTTPTPPPTPIISGLDSGDYNGDGTSDIAIFRPASGLWAIKNITRLYFGTQGDLPVSADYNGDGATDPGIFRPASGLWVIPQVTRVYFGGQNDTPVPGDYYHQGFCRMAIFRKSSGLWAVKDAGRVYFGRNTDHPVPGYYGESGAKDVAVFRPASGMWAVRELSTLYFGTSGDLPVPAAYGISSIWNAAVFRPLSNLWAIRNLTRAYFGDPGDQPVPADYLGDGRSDLAVFRASSGMWAISGLTSVFFGRDGDIPLPGRAIR